MVKLAQKLDKRERLILLEIGPGFCLGIASYWIECKRLIIAVLQGLFNRLIVGGPFAL